MYLRSTVNATIPAVKADWAYVAVSPSKVCPITDADAGFILYGGLPQNQCYNFDNRAMFVDNGELSLNNAGVGCLTIERLSYYNETLVCEAGSVASQLGAYPFQMTSPPTGSTPTAAPTADTTPTATTPTSGNTPTASTPAKKSGSAKLHCALLAVAALGVFAL